MNNELIIFDFFGVICGEIAPYVFENHFDKQTAVRLKQELFVPADCGDVTMDALFDKMSSIMNISRADLEKEWNSYIIIDNELVQYIKKLHENYSIALLSNAPLGVVEGLLEEFGLGGLFDKVIVSSAVKIAKPNIEVYKLCVSSFGRKFDKIYMVDDNVANLQPVAELGITPIHYKTIDDLKKIFDK